MKQAVRLGKDMPFAERLVHSFDTSNLMKRHLARRRKDSRRLLPSREDLHDMQVPVVKGLVSKKRPADDDDEGVDAFGLAPVGVDPALHDLRQGNEFFVDCGDSEWPVRADVISSFLDSHPGLQAWDQKRVAGLRNQARTARRHTVCSYVVHDKQDITDDTEYFHRFSCSEAHLGLCATADAAVYSDALKLARNLERALDDEYVHRFLAIIWQPECPAGAPPDEQVLCVYLARKRERRMHCQITHCFISCALHDVQDGVHIMSLAERTAKEFDFRTTWEFAKEMLYGNVEKAVVFKMTHDPGDLRVSNMVRASLSNNDPGRVVWPGKYKRPRAPRHGLLDIPDEPQDPPPPKPRRPKPMKVRPYNNSQSPSPIMPLLLLLLLLLLLPPRIALVAQCQTSSSCYCR